MKKIISGTTLEAVQGDIVNQPEVEAVVNAANAQLTMGGGQLSSCQRQTSTAPASPEPCMLYIKQTRYCITIVNFFVTPPRCNYLRSAPSSVVP